MHKERPLISVVSPVYGAEKIVSELVRQLLEALEKMDASFEIVLIEDGSPDDSWSAMEKEAHKDPRVLCLKLSRNFGQQYAITAGLDYARGHHVVVMDCDLQDDPADIPALYEKAQEGFDVVFALKKERRHSRVRNLFSGIFFSLFNRLADNQAANVSEGSFSILSRKAVEGFRSYRDVHRHYLMILRSMGFKRGTVEVEHHPRFEGESSYDFRRLCALALDGVTSQSTKLLRLAIGIGFLYFLASIIGIAYFLIRYFVSDSQPPAGWASSIIVLLASTGLILMALGILGVYIGNIYEQSKGRPLYIVAESINCDAITQVK